MSLIYTERLSDSPYVATITYGLTTSEGVSVRPAEYHWHMVFAKHEGSVHPLMVGPWTTAGVASWGAGAEILWIKFKPGTFMPHLSPKAIRDTETVLPGAAGQSFWLKGSAWNFPDFENAETFVDWLVRDEMLVHDPVVNAALQDQPLTISPRTVRHRFLRATGLTQGGIRQMQRAQQAMTLLQQGVSVLDTVCEAGYFDQPHLTRSLKRLAGYTPAQIVRSSENPTG